MADTSKGKDLLQEGGLHVRALASASEYALRITNTSGTHRVADNHGSIKSHQNPINKDLNLNADASQLCYVATVFLNLAWAVFFGHSPLRITRVLFNLQDSGALSA